MATASLWSHKGRTVLTIIGVVIGTGSVIAVTGLGAAFEASITSQFDSVDATSIFVTATQDGPQNGPPDAGQFGTIFTAVDRQALEALPGVARVEASGTVPVSGLTIGSTTLPFRSLTATQVDSTDVRNPADYAGGSVFAAGREEAVLGADIADILEIGVGDMLGINRPDGTTINATVTGILARDESLFGTRNGQVYVPVDPFHDTRIRSPSTGQQVPVFDGFTVVAVDAVTTARVQDGVADYFGEGRGSDADRLRTTGIVIAVATASDITQQISASFDQATVFIAAIAATSLLVGGIMIGTIMLINVTERTREIGVLKALGARDREVLQMFLLEAAIIGLVGSLLGAVVGLVGGYALTEGLFGDQDVSFVPAYDWLVIGISVGTLTGVIAGLLPARRATKVQPVVALSYE